MAPVLTHSVATWCVCCRRDRDFRKLDKELRKLLEVKDPDALAHWLAIRAGDKTAEIPAKTLGGSLDDR
jgi:hypothetical protein